MIQIIDDPLTTGPALQMVRLFVDNVDGGSCKRGSRKRPNWTISAAETTAMLRALICGHVRFERDDWGEIYKIVNGRWGSTQRVIHCDHGETWYRLMCETGNASAASSFEASKARLPWRCAVIPPQHNYGRGRPLDRLYERARFLAADGTEWTVTSMKDDLVIACRYEAGRSAPMEIRKLDRDALKAMVTP